MAGSGWRAMLDHFAAISCGCFVCGCTPLTRSAPRPTQSCASKCDQQYTSLLLGGCTTFWRELAASGCRLRRPQCPPEPRLPHPAVGASARAPKHPQVAACTTCTHILMIDSDSQTRGATQVTQGMMWIGVEAGLPSEGPVRQDGPWAQASHRQHPDTPATVH